MRNYIFASNKNWHIEYFMSHRSELSGNWSIVTCPEDLAKQVATVYPRYVFFPHWSEMVEPEIYNAVECVCFHMTDLPFGRGGSPLQNLILRGVKQTKITALKMTGTIDGGPVYQKNEMDLLGSALEIYKASVPICFEMMETIVRDEPVPVEQVGKTVQFQRRKPADSELNEAKTVQQVYDYVRMLDAPGYPPAYLMHQEMKIEFTEAEIDAGNQLVARVRITQDEK